MADNYTFKDASGNTVTHASEEISAGVHASRHVSVDDAGVMLAKAEDAAHSSGDKGIMLLAVRQDSAGALAGTEGDYIPLICDANGRLYVASDVAAAVGDVAHDDVDSGNPLKMGGRARDVAGVGVAVGDRVNAWFDQWGRLKTSPENTFSTPLYVSGRAGNVSIGLGTITLADTEQTFNLASLGSLPHYSMRIRCREDIDIRISFVTGKVTAALYAGAILIPAGTEWTMPAGMINNTFSTLYVAAAVIPSPFATYEVEVYV